MISKRYYPKCPNCNARKEVFLKFPGVNDFDIYFCELCKNGFTIPIPQNIAKYYHSHYWNSPGILGRMKQLIFNIFHQRRRTWVLKYLKEGSILEIGAGEGNFAKLLSKNFQVTGIELPAAQIKNKKILKVDYSKWKSREKFDAIIFWESLEHVSKPQQYLKKSYKLLKNNGLVFIEFPRFDCIESKIFKNYWFHLDPPRHLVHMTSTGISKLLERTNYKVIEQKSVFAFEYVIWGFLESILDIFGFKSTDYFKKSKFPIFFIFLLPLIALSLIAETLFLLLDQSPINLIIATKNG